MRLNIKPREALILYIISFLIFNSCVPLIEYDIDKARLKFTIDGSSLTADINIDIVEVIQDGNKIKKIISFNNETTPWEYDYLFRTQYNIYCFEIKSYEARLNINVIAGTFPANGHIFIDGEHKASIEVLQPGITYSVVGKFELREGSELLAFACGEDYH